MRKKRRLPSDTSRCASGAGSSADLEQRAQRPAVDRKLVAPARTRPPTSSRCAVEHRVAARARARRSGTPPRPSRSRRAPAPAPRRCRRASASKRVRNHQSAPSSSSRARGPGTPPATVPGTLAGAQSTSTADDGSATRRGRAGQLPATGELADLVSVAADAAHGGFERRSAGLRRAPSIARLQRVGHRLRSAARSRTGGGGRAGTTSPCTRRRSRQSRRRPGCARRRTATVRGTRGSRTPTRPSARSQTRTRGSRSSPRSSSAGSSVRAPRRSARTGCREVALRDGRRALDRGTLSSSPGVAGPESKRTSSAYGGSTSSENPLQPEHAPVVLAVELEQAGTVEVTQRLGFGIDRIGRHRGLDVLGPVAGGRGVGQVPRVELDDDRATRSICSAICTGSGR